MSEREKFERILGLLNEAVLDDTRWPTASGLLDDALQVRGNTLAHGVVHPGGEIQFFSMGFFFHGQRNRELEREYLEIYLPQDERVPRFLQLPDSQLTHMSEFYTEEALKTSVVYNDYLARMQTQNGITVRMDGPDGLNIGWGIHDPVDGNGWSSTQFDSIRRLMPHIGQYVRVRQSLASAGALGASLTELLDTTGLGIIHLDRRGRIVEMNDRARNLLRAGDGLFDERGFLFARTPEDNARLQGLLKQALPPSKAQGVGGSTIVRRASALPLLLHANPVDQQGTDSSVWPIAALVLIVDPESRTRIESDIAGAALDLTAAESRVAVLLAEGMNVRQIAAATDRKESTIRWHVKNILDKLGLSRQTDLVRLLLPLANAPETQD